MLQSHLWRSWPTLRAGISALACCLVSSVAFAQNAGWQGQITPYVWATGVEGNITPFSGAPAISYERSFSDTLKDLDAAFFINGFARKERFVVTGDLLYASLSRKGQVFPGISANGKLRMAALTLNGGYRAIDDSVVTLDVMAGARVWRTRASVSVPVIGEQKSSIQTFVDPVVALRANFSLSPDWSILAYGDIGGLGAGSELTRQFALSANYQVNDNIYVSTGYRYLDLDYKRNGMRLDTNLTGPFLGLTWKF
ncbi:hypothetical protein GCM10011450_11770 [Advenella faeciporci]|uniref:Outer membrane protein beta-barrel domain-containing protein n=1 Tax=Advenella faeciporci TaxID=797535 RepID=A0A918JJK0_9BURK|nr:hypothetical protein [Advenella faeciporci]NLY34512.1 hypothetical protein [Alcaligenaceae bacterium]GGW83430.1 hypothetical protein GCM10011450_11770 [Advenella faeciporci]